MQAEVDHHIKRVESDSYVVTLRCDGIIHVHYKDDVVIDRALQLELERVFFEMTRVERPFIITSGEFVSITRDARDYALEMENKVPVSGFIPVIHNLAQRIIADYFYRFNNRHKPSRSFTDMNEAIHWIRSNFEIAPVPYV